MLALRYASKSHKLAQLSSFTCLLYGHLWPVTRQNLSLGFLTKPDSKPAFSATVTNSKIENLLVANQDMINNREADQTVQMRRCSTSPEDRFSPVKAHLMSSLLFDLKII